MVLQDTQLAFFKREGLGNTVSDGMHAYLCSLSGQTSGQINSLWSSVFDKDSIPSGNHNDRLFAWYYLKGARGPDLSSRAREYWSNL